MAAKEINDAGGVLGGPIEFIFRDDKLKPDEAVKAARELVLQEKVDFLAGCISQRRGAGHLRVREGSQDALLRHALPDLAADLGRRAPLRRPHHQQREPVHAGAAPRRPRRCRSRNGRTSRPTTSTATTSGRSSSRT